MGARLEGDTEDGVLYVEDFEGALEDLRGRGMVLLDFDFPDLELKTVDGVANIGETRAAWFADSEGDVIAVIHSPRRVRRMRDSRHRLTAFFLMTTALFVPFWVLGAVKPVDLLPGLPIAALATFAPATAAAILVYHYYDCRGLAAFLRRSFDFGRTESKVWYLPVLLLSPAVMLTAYALHRLLGGSGALPRITLANTLALGAVFFVGALGEELGWSGYATDPMQERWGALGAALLLGLAWAAYHFIALVQEGRDATWIAFWTLNTIALRVLIVWLYDSTGRSVFAAALFHATTNVTWQLFTVDSTLYYPALVSLVTAGIAVSVSLAGRLRTGWTGDSGDRAVSGNPSHSADTGLPDI